MLDLIGLKLTRLNIPQRFFFLALTPSDSVRVEKIFPWHEEWKTLAVEMDQGKSMLPN